MVNQPNSLVWIELQKTNLEAVKNFYDQVFGWTNETEQNGYVLFSAAGRAHAGAMKIE